jgi:hypothetical protein
LEDEILKWERGKSMQVPEHTSSTKIVNLVADLQRDAAIDLQDKLQLPSSTKLDKSQAICFLAGLDRRVTLIQGPPGMLLLRYFVDPSEEAFMLSIQRDWQIIHRFPHY